MGDPVALNVQHLTKTYGSGTKRPNRPRRCELYPRDRINLRSRPAPRAAAKPRYSDCALGWIAPVRDRSRSTAWI